jgi:alpha-tubulin suppressor-like RCC1 family protein
VPDLTGVIELKAALEHWCARLVDGTVKCWGHNARGQLGFPRDVNDKEWPPRLVPGLTDVAELALDNGHTCVRRGNGDILCFGSNELGELGAPTEEPWSARPVVVVFPP